MTAFCDKSYLQPDRSLQCQQHSTCYAAPAIALHLALLHLSMQQRGPSQSAAHACMLTIGLQCSWLSAVQHWSAALQRGPPDVNPEAYRTLCNRGACYMHMGPAYWDAACKVPGLSIEKGRTNRKAMSTWSGSWPCMRHPVPAMPCPGMGVPVQWLLLQVTDTPVTAHHICVQCGAIVSPLCTLKACLLSLTGHPANASTMTLPCMCLLSRTSTKPSGCGLISGVAGTARAPCSLCSQTILGQWRHSRCAFRHLSQEDSSRAIASAMLSVFITQASSADVFQV